MLRKIVANWAKTMDLRLTKDEIEELSWYLLMLRIKEAIR